MKEKYQAKRGAEQFEGITEKKKPRVAVVGAGVIGLTNAILAQEAGYQVTVYSDLPTSQTTSYYYPTSVF